VRGRLSFAILDSDYLWQVEGTMADTGELRFSGDDFDVKPGAEAAEEDPSDPIATRSAVACLLRTVEGTLDPAFSDQAGGKLEAAQRTRIDFVSEPQGKIGDLPTGADYVWGRLELLNHVATR
jgi:hypothetical protein